MKVFFGFQCLFSSVLSPLAITSGFAIILADDSDSRNQSQIAHACVRNCENNHMNNLQKTDPGFLDDMRSIILGARINAVRSVEYTHE